MTDMMTDFLMLCVLKKYRGSHFLKKWMEFLEDKADLRYPDLSSLSQ